jgi:hypothetical protein
MSYVPEAILKLLGRVPDEDVARQTGYSQSHVSRIRRVMGIPVCPESTKRFARGKSSSIPHREAGVSNEEYLKRRAFIVENWLNMTDEEMAEELGVSKAQIGKLRRSQGLHRLAPRSEMTQKPLAKPARTRPQKIRIKPKK